MKKGTGFAAFIKKGAPQQSVEAEQPAAERKRGKGEVVAMTLRLPRADWERVHHLAVAEGTSIQSLVTKGLSRLFKEKGLAELTQ